MPLSAANYTIAHPAPVSAVYVVIGMWWGACQLRPLFTLA